MEVRADVEGDKDRYKEEEEGVVRVPRGVEVEEVRVRSGKGILLSGVVVRRAQSEQRASKGKKTENVERESRETVLVYFQGMCALPFERRIRSQFHTFHGILFTTSQPLTHATYTNKTIRTPSSPPCPFL